MVTKNSASACLGDTKQKGFTSLDAILTLAIAGGLSMYTVIMSDLVEQGIDIHTQKQCHEADRIKRTFPQVSLTDEYLNACLDHKLVTKTGHAARPGDTNQENI